MREEKPPYGEACGKLRHSSLRDGRNEGRAKRDVGEKGDHDETSAYLECVSVDCPPAETELVSYRQMNEPHLK